VAQLLLVEGNYKAEVRHVYTRAVQDQCLLDFTVEAGHFIEELVTGLDAADDLAKPPVEFCRRDGLEERGDGPHVLVDEQAGVLLY